MSCPAGPKASAKRSLELLECTDRGVDLDLRASLRGKDFLPSRGSARSRQWTRDFFNLLELQVEEIFERYDHDRSGFLEVGELELLLRDLNDGVKPPQDETLWLMQIADKDGNSMLSKDELLHALRAWNGYLHMPRELEDLFAECDKNGNGYLDLAELRVLLSRVAGQQVSEREAKEVLDIADVLGDGHLGRYELMGAIGSWYISVGRQPTPAMSLAFAANNRSSSRWHRFVHYFMVLTLVPTSYFPLAAYFGSSQSCSSDIPHMLLADGILWILLSLVLLMKGHWMQLLNSLCSHAKAARFVYRMSWGIVITELLICTLLCVIEAVGVFWTRVEEASGKRRSGCNEGASTPVDVPVSILEGRLESYPSFLEFCHIWFTFNFEFNFVFVALYYGWLVYRFFKVWKADRALQKHEEQAEQGESDGETEAPAWCLKGRTSSSTATSLSGFTEDDRKLATL